jgi:hypothetical protein
MVLKKSVEAAWQSLIHPSLRGGDQAMLGERTVFRESLFYSFNLDRPWR